MSASLAFDPASGTSLLYGGNEDERRGARGDLGLGRLHLDSPGSARPGAGAVAGRDGRRHRTRARWSSTAVTRSSTWSSRRPWATPGSGSGRSWALRFDKSRPGPLVNAQAMAHPQLGIVVAGGSDLERAAGDVWHWAGDQWLAIAPDVFPARQAFGLAYDAARDTIVLTGGIVRPGEPGAAPGRVGVDRGPEHEGDPGVPGARQPEPGRPVTRAATPRGSRRRPAPAAPARSSGRRAAARALDLGGAHGAAVVLQREVDDAERLQRRGRPGRRSAAGMPGGAPSRARCRRFDQLVGHLGPPAGDVERGQRGWPSSSSAARSVAVGLADVGQLAAGRRHAPSRLDRGAGPVRHQPEPGAGDDHGLAGLEGGGVERRRAAEPDRVALGGERQPRRARRPRAAAGRGRRPASSVPSAPGRPATAWVASSPSTASTTQVGDRRGRAASAVPHQARRAGGRERSGHGRRGYAAADLTAQCA